MFTKRGLGGLRTPAQPAPSSPSSPTQPVQPTQIPYVNQPLPSGPEALDPTITEEAILEDPTLAENHLHAALTVRALKWLELLKQDENQNPQPGQRLVTLDTQVQMFKVIAEWLKTSKKTKEAGTNEEGTPGIDAMRQAIREEMAKLADDKPKKRQDTASEEEWVNAEPVSTRPPRRYGGGGQPGNQNGAKKPDDSTQLMRAINRAREASYKEDN